MRHYITMCLLAGSLAGSAQQMVPLSYRNYMEKVAEGNLEYAAERLNMNVSEAEVVASKVFNDPNLSVSYFNNENGSLQMGEGVEVELKANWRRRCLPIISVTCVPKQPFPTWRR